MKIIHVAESLESSGGGMPAAIKSLMKLQQALGYQVICAVTTRSASGNVFNDGNILSIGTGSLVGTLLRLGKLCSLILRRQADVVHIHGVWNIFYPLLCLLCKFSETKYFVSTQGQVLSTILQSDPFLKRLKKKVYYHLFAGLILRGASKIHVSGENERSEFSRNKKISKKIVMIPNIMDEIFFDSGSIRESLKSCDNENSKFKDVLFVGRLDIRKGVLDLIDGFASSGLPKNWRLRIVGPNSAPSFLKLMSEKISAAQMTGRILIEQPVYGDSRVDLYLSCYVFCLPSYSEATGLVNIEAALVGRPVITTPYTGLLEIKEHGGVLCNTGQESIGAALRDVASWTDSEYFSRSERIQSWAKSKFSIEVISSRWQSFYS